MSGSNRRLADRVPVEVPVQIDGTDGLLEAATADLSRTGARLRIPAAALGATAELDLASAAELVREALPSKFWLRLHYKVLGPLLERTATAGRISIPLDAPDCIELGCAFDRPLSVDAVASLGAPLPPVDGDGEQPLLRADMPAPFVREGELAPLAPPAAVPAKGEVEGEIEERESAPHPAPEPLVPAAAPAPLGAAGPRAPAPAPRFASSVKYVYRAYLKSDVAAAQSTLLGNSDQLSRDAVRVRMARKGYEGLTVVEATILFSQRHGTRGGLKIMNGSTHLYTGPVRVCSIELPAAHAGEMLITLAFDRRLNPAETRRLGLTSEAA